MRADGSHEAGGLRVRGEGERGEAGEQCQAAQQAAAARRSAARSRGLVVGIGDGFHYFEHRSIKRGERYAFGTVEP